MVGGTDYPNTLEWLQKNNRISGDFVSNHCISWIDILGFRNKMKSPVADLNEYLVRINNAIADSLKMLEYKTGNKIEYRLFSDNILIFVKLHGTLTDVLDIYNVVICTTYIQAILTCYFGIQVRGCICNGLFYSNDKFVFGPAIAYAYDLESNEVKMPRILVDDSIFKTLSDYSIYLDPSCLKNFEKIIIKEDDRYYVDYYSVYGSDKARSDLPHIQSSMELIVLEYRIRPDPKVIDKINYTISKFNEFCNKFNLGCTFPKLEKPNVGIGDSESTNTKM